MVHDPRKAAKLGKKLETITYEFARKELDRVTVDNIEGGMLLFYNCRSCLTFTIYHNDCCLFLTSLRIRRIIVIDLSTFQHILSNLAMIL